MRCDRARELIHRETESMVSDAERRELRAHLYLCPCCAEYAADVRGLLLDLAADRDAVALASEPSSAFEARLHELLMDERVDQARKWRLPRAALGEWLIDRQTLAARTLRGAMAVAFVTASILAGSALLAPPSARPQDCRVDHLASFDMQRSADGRVYAELTQHGSACRPQGWEVGSR